jgi:PLP dependent protein
MSLISDNLQVVSSNLRAYAAELGRDPEQIQLLAVSKTFDVQAVLDAATAGQRAFGENYVQEAVDKVQAAKQLAPELNLEWHFIGPIQSNKTRLIAEHFDWVHSVDREKIAMRLSEQRPANLPPLNVCLQVNISNEDSKSGVAPQDVLTLAVAIAKLPNLKLRGLMAVPEPAADFEQQRVPFRQLRDLNETLIKNGFAVDTLSIGMSSDMHAAIAEGSTMVRIGTAIFGKRSYGNP